MASRLKEDERNERSIRNLMKLSENRRCINCNSLGPQYVCTSFCTFVCTTCSGIHREFTHRVKSVSMAKFSTQEVSALQGGGNASAKEIYFKEWDAQRQSFPDSSNVERLRDFIKHVYVDRRYSGERSFDKPPRAKMGEAEGSRSPPYENERNYSDRPSPGGRSDVSSRNSYDERRSPGYDQDFKKIPAQTDNIVNDWRREDRFGKKSDTGSSKIEVRSPDRQRDPDNVSSPPIVIPVRDILGDSVSPLRVIEPLRANGSLQPQRTASSSSLASSNGNPTELRRESSLIDFEADPEPPSTAAVPQTHATAPSPAPAPAPFMAPPTVSSNDNWASFDSSPVIKASQQPPPSSVNLLDMLSELSVPASRNNPVVASGQVSSFGTTAPVTSQPIYNAFGIQPPTSISNQAGGGSLNNPVVASGQVSSFGTTAPVVTPQPIYNAFGIQPPTSMFNQAGGGSLNNQAWTPSLSGNTQLPSSTPSAESQVTSGIEAKPTAKQELPADLFTSSYSPFAAQGQGWYPAPQYGMGFNMQYNVPQPMPPAFIQPSKSSNPFDLNESRAAQPTAFPSMAPLQGALPNTGPPSGMQQTPSVGDPAPTWMSHQSSYPLAMPPQGSSYGSSMPSGPFMGQVPQNMPPQSRPQVGNFGYDMSSFGFLNTNQQVYATAPSTTRNNTFSSNPFG